LSFVASSGTSSENLAEFDGLFSNINCVDKVPDEVPEEERKVNNTLKTYRVKDSRTVLLADCVH